MTVRTPEKGEKLLDKLSQGYSVTAACKAEGISRNAYYMWINDDLAFKAATEQAIEAGTDILEDVARKRAGGPLHGSDTLLIFLLKGRRPEKFKERIDARHGNPDGSPIGFNVVIRERPDGPQ